MNRSQNREASGFEAVKHPTVIEFNSVLFADSLFLAGKSGGIGDSQLVFQCHHTLPFSDKHFFQHGFLDGFQLFQLTLMKGDKLIQVDEISAYCSLLIGAGWV